MKITTKFCDVTGLDNPQPLARLEIDYEVNGWADQSVGCNTHETDEFDLTAAGAVVVLYWMIADLLTRNQKQALLRELRRHREATMKTKGLL